MSLSHLRLQPAATQPLPLQACRDTCRSHNPMPRKLLYSTHKPTSMSSAPSPPVPTHPLCLPHLHKLSTSSMKMMLGAFSRASLNSSDTSFSLSPSHLDTRSLLLMLKKVLSASVATAWGMKGEEGRGWRALLVRVCESPPPPHADTHSHTQPQLKALPHHHRLTPQTSTPSASPPSPSLLLLASPLPGMTCPCLVGRT